jgi:hypothetical protein
MLGCSGWGLDLGSGLGPRQRQEKTQSEFLEEQRKDTSEFLEEQRKDNHN